MTSDLSYETKTARLSFGTKVSYALGALADGSCYVLFYSFFMYFLTDIVGVNPLWAGSVTMIVILWDAVTDPLVGYLSDRSKSGKGRRRPFIIFGIFPWVVTLTLVFTTVNLSPVTQFAYYIVMAMLFWLSYTIVDVPYKALGAELTQDYAERSEIRLFAQVASGTGVIIGSAGTIAIVNAFFNSGLSINTSWTFTAFVFGLISFVAYFLTWRLTKGKEPQVARLSEDSINREPILKTYIGILTKVKPYKWIVLIIMTFMVGNSMFGSGIVYGAIYLAGLDAPHQSLMFLIGGIIGLIYTPILSRVVLKIDKKYVLTFCLAVSTFGLFLFRFVGLDSWNAVIAYFVFYELCNFGFWGMIWALVYDLSEVDELITGCRREGSVTSLGSFMQKCGSALAMWIIGVTLSLSGYDAAAAAQTDQALTGILNMCTLYPGVFTAISLILLVLYPMNKKTYGLVRDALVLKKEGKTYSAEGLERLL